jgi:hypothetical protein
VADVRPGDPLAFEDLVDHYDAARPHYPQGLYDALGALGVCLELGAGTGIASVELALRAASLVVSDLGPRMLERGLSCSEAMPVPAPSSRASPRSPRASYSATG